MLNSIQPQLFKKLSFALTILALFSLYSCLPTSTAPRLSEGSADAGDNSSAPTYAEPTYPLSGTFLQEGTTQTSTNLALPVSFSDSFLIRGKNLSVYLRSLPNTTKFCIVGKFNHEPGYDKFLVLSAKPKSFTDLINKTTEFYLQVEPANDQANQNDCLTYNLSNSLFANATNPSLSFSYQQLCTNCSTAITSNGLKLYFINGEEAPTLNISSLLLTLSGSGNTSSNGCGESSACVARGYDCCLQSQCVNDGALRPGAIDLPGFLAAQEDVRLNPNRFVVYPQYYFVCATRPENPGNPGGGETTDPDYEASIRLLELKQLYDCANQVDGEFSYCTLKYENASTRIPGNFSAADDGYVDDINYSTLNPNLTGDYRNNIVKIVYAGKTLYELNKTPLTEGAFVINTANDNLTTSQSVTITSSLPTNAQDANLYLTYKVDGTCEKLGTSLAKCTKTYIQNYSDLYSTFWHTNGNKTYKLPSYADLSSSSNVIVKVSGVVVPEDATTWSKSDGNKSITFVNTYPIYQNQKIEITYFVTTNIDPLVKIRSGAQAKINSMCSCSASSKCNITPVLNESNAIIDYQCSYPANPIPDDPPANQTVYVSNKNTPHRYFDTNGVSYDESYGSAPDQEGAAFSYINNDILKPSNTSQYIGFNEIYGSFAKSGTYTAKPAKLVKIKKDKEYDIIVNSGVFSTCATCGADYYSSLQKIFPQNFSGQAGGYAPDYLNSSRVNNTGTYRSDDLLFGRACFVPATMIPWTHISSSSPRDQRVSRLAAQHFMFANGYNRDWYGFDYGSLIGSFDGVSWFSIGNQRRIKSKTNKLFLAVNSFYSDLNADSSFNVIVSETTAFSSDIPDHDTETDGAQCQSAHFCSNDNDCFKQLGYDYTCQNIAGLTTSWPQFDGSGTELVGSSLRTLASIVGGSNGKGKRCIYRGRGTPCLNDLNLAATSTTFNGSPLIGTLTCSPNNSCTPVNNSRFNDRIARFANSPVAQNAVPVVTQLSDTVGLGARILGRPFDYYGTKATPNGALLSLTTNNISAICTPGKDVNNSTDMYELNQRLPAIRTESSDKLFGTGPASNLSMSPKALNACPATDAAGNSMQLFDLPLGDTVLNSYSISQNLSSNLLNLAPLINLNIYSSTSGSQITGIGYQRNTCLRAPGASCFSDMECAPSSFIASRAKSADLSGVLNSAEEKYWEEELICGNPDFKYLAVGIPNPLFDVKKNACCRDVGKELTVFTQTSSSAYKWCDTTTNQVRVAGVNTPISSSSRYSRVHSGFDKMTCDPSQITSSKKFALSLEASDTATRLTQILGQFKTLDTINQRTCCTQNWVRSFASENGGGHKFVKTKMQTVDKAMFKHVSWNPQSSLIVPNPAGDGPFECDPSNFANASCEIRSLTPSEEEKYLTWAASLELIGIPQVAVKSNDQIFQIVDDSQLSNAAMLNPLVDSNGEEVIKRVSVVGADFTDANGSYYSGSSYTKFNVAAGRLKKVFSESEFNCCLPSGIEVTDTTTPEQCCTGNIANVDGPRRCCLPDFTDLTVYLNRYVSSEGRGLPDSSYDMKTGYIKDPGQVRLLAQQKNLCCSGTIMTGVAINQLSIPLTGGTYLPANSLNTTRRLNYRSDAVDSNSETGSVGSIFDAGVRWNNHVYCVPAGFTN